MICKQYIYIFNVAYSKFDLLIISLACFVYEVLKDRGGGGRGKPSMTEL